MSFAPISEENVGRIFDAHLRRQGIILELSPKARQHLALSSFTPKYGARPITGVIRTHLRRLIISGEARPGTSSASAGPRAATR